MKITLLSFVIPAYKQEKTIAQDIKNLDTVLSKLPFKHEIIVVADGFEDKTYERAKSVKNKNVRIFGYEKNQGKGHAVKFGMLKAKGNIIGFIDAGGDIKASGIPILLELMSWRDADIIVGSKVHPESKVKYPISRKILTLGYRVLTHAFFGFDVRDTQVGLKLFKRKVIRDVLSKVLVKAFAFDVEILAVANELGYKKIYEGPVELNFNNKSSITSENFWRIWRIMFLTLWDTMAVFYRLKILRYYQNKD